MGVVKRAFDVVLSCVALMVSSPLLILISIAIRVTMGSPVLFRHIRPGLHRRPFTLYKFRSMRGDLDGTSIPLSDTERITSLGRLLRRTSLDELPELWNVLRGDMSFVGPRPLLLEYLPLYTTAQARRHDVRSGITGWAQVRGRNAITWEEKFALDAWYVDHQCFWLDLKILAMTIPIVLRREGINQEGHATVEAFTGTPTSESSYEMRDG